MLSTSLRVAALCAALPTSCTGGDPVVDNPLDTLVGQPSAPAPADLGVTAPSAAPDLAPAPTTTAPPQPTVSALHRRCGWIGAGDTVGAASFIAHADWFDAIHPDWWALETDGVHLRAILGADSPGVIAAARAHHVLVIPLIASVEDAAITRRMLGDPAIRAAHVQALVDLAQTHRYDGVELDYEHLWSAADRPGMTAFAGALAAAMHAAGKQLSLAVPPLPTLSPNSAWDLSSLATFADTLHVMGYDLHTVGSHSGPVSPLGWIDAVAAQVAATGHPEKFVLGLPNYGVTQTWFTTNRAAAGTCGPGHATTTDHMASCPLGSWAPGRSPHCTTAGSGELYFDDLGSLEEKVAAAAAHHLGGITYWTVGDEVDGFFEMVQRHF